MSAVAVAQNQSTFGVLRNRNFTFLWSGQLVSTIGSSLSSLAASILIYRLTGSALSVGLMLIATAAPAIVLGLIAGVFVDRYDRKKIMIAADLIRAVLTFLVPFLIPYSIAWLYILVLLSSSVTQFYDPAHSSVLPDVASDDELAAANSLMAISAFGSTAVGFAASGLIASAFPIAYAFYIDAVTFLISAVCVYLVHIPQYAGVGDTKVSTIFKNMRIGFNFLTHTPILRSMFILFPLIGISFGLWNTLLLPFARQALNATEFEYGLQEAITSVGFVAGSLLMARLADRLHEGQWLTLSFVGMGFVLAIYSTLTSIPLAFLLVIFSGFANAPSSITRNLLVQRYATRDMRGRVASLFFVTRDAAFILGMAGAGLADYLGVRVMLLGAAILVLIPGGLALVLPGLREPPEEWRRTMHLLRTVHERARLPGARPATLADMDALVGLQPAFSGLSQEERRSLATKSFVYDAPEGTTVIKQGEGANAVYFILRGRAVGGTPTESGGHTASHTMGAGEFFGERAALRGIEHLTNVVTAEPSTLLEVPAGSLKHFVEHPSLRQVLRQRVHVARPHFHLSDLPRAFGSHHATYHDLRQDHGDLEEQPESKT